ncbi:hypothetical protein K3G63_22115 [Hymenobacter sp. HSC-4F20]|uniref:hypothetical protein n=1 Tax=Hymenobacter sp. HSC-4F20 TaxID=2864135 RepID=UPI001C72E607|nr:hypothetical protein [Hymenobacter sp. HSC-4F20]MBX0293157.1 hypothetical protein [Hymenobacter sp. HSC-4F20]
MSRRNELLISGVDLSAEDVAELQAILPDDATDVTVMGTKSVFNDLVQLVFYDFTPVALVRDYMLTEALVAAYNYIKPVILQLVRKGMGAGNVCIEKDMVSKEGVPFLLYVVTSAQRYEVIIKQLEEVPPEQTTPRSPGTTIVVRHDEKGNLDIHIMGD